MTGEGVKLTPRQLDILPLVADGLSNIEIGKRLFIEAATVQMHMAHMLRLADARNRAQLVAIAFREGLIT